MSPSSNIQGGTTKPQTGSGGAASSSSVSTKPVHPITFSSVAPTGCELSVWAYITSPRPNGPNGATSTSSIDPLQNHNNEKDDRPSSLPDELPNLVTAHANSLKIYAVDPKGGTLLLASSYENLAGTIVSLNVLPKSAGNSIGEVYDGLLLGFAGHPRLSIVYPPGGLDTCDITIDNESYEDMMNDSNVGWSGVLAASSILDLSSALFERSWGSVTPMEQDLSCAVTSDKKVPTVSVILGGGVAVATFQMPRSNYIKDSSSSWWRIASEPYLLPLSNLSKSLITSQKNSVASLQSNKHNKFSANTTLNQAKASHGFGDILSSAFLLGYTEPVLTLLHSNPNRQGGRTWPGRLAHHSSSTRAPLTLTAVSVSIEQKRSVVLWTLRDAIPSDAYQLYQHPKGGVLIVCVNELLYVDCSGKIQCCTAVNGWVKSTASSALRPKNGITAGIIQPNPSPLAKLSIQLDGCRLVFVNDSVALVSLRNGSLYSLELHEKKDTIGVGGAAQGMCMSLSPVGQKLGALGMISTLCTMPLLHIPSVRRYFHKFLDETKQLGHAKKENTAKESIPDSELEKSPGSSLSALGLIFAGSRLGDSTLLLYGLEEKVKLVPLEDEEKERNNQRKRSSKEELKEKSGKSPSAIGSKRIKVDEETIETGSEKDAVVTISDDEARLSEEEILRREEDALYVQTDKSILGANIEGSFQRDESDDDEQVETKTLLPRINAKQLYRPQIRAISMFKHMKVLDSLTGLGPIGSGCEGPIAYNLPVTSQTKMSRDEVFSGSTMNIHPCGYGSSGGLAIQTSPGLNYGSTIISEADCVGMGSIYNCPHFGFVFLAKKERNAGCMLLKSVKSPTEQNAEKELVEIDLKNIISNISGGLDMEDDMPSFYNVTDVLTRMTILSVKEFYTSSGNESSNIMIMANYGSAYAIVILCRNEENKLVLRHSHMIGACDETITIERETLVSVTVLENLDSAKASDSSIGLSLGCVWRSGHASIFTISFSIHSECVVKEIILQGNEEADQNGNDPSVRSDKVMALDMFSIADNIFTQDSSRNSASKYDPKKAVLMESSAVSETKTDIFDEDDVELYGMDVQVLTGDGKSKPASFQTRRVCSDMPPSRFNTLGGYISGANLSDTEVSVVAICRESGQLQLFDVAKLFSTNSFDLLVQQVPKGKAEESLLWNCERGCGYGAQHLSTSGSSDWEPNFHEVHVSEMKFFFCGPSDALQQGAPHRSDLSILRSLCFLVETSLDDLQLYTVCKSRTSDTVGFRRVPLRMVSRISKEEKRHRAKLRRKGMATVCDEEENLYFRPNRFHRFFSLSGQDGLFAATSRPLWFLSERGAPSALCHRLRYCAPAGGSEVPVSGFCAGITMNDNSMSKDFGFMIVHERIGRVGSQRVTLFNGLSDIFTPYGLLPGNGQFIQKIPLGVTVLQIQHINDATVSSASNPLYTLLVARETETDQSHLNDDGLTETERREAKERKEKERMQKQVEADLGGFDVEQEWVEEIEREDCFVIEKRYGGAPPISNRIYEIWLVDASNWQIVDTYQMEEFEHGVTMKFMSLSDISEEPQTLDVVPESSMFLVVGTGIIDNDGEDVASRGRILLFQVKASSSDQNSETSAEISFFYDKEISIGPVTTLNNLICENQSRLVVGAGAEVTIEQWGNGKLLQVGFFHAQMHVQDIVLFKTFFLLSDAYDSFHFLVWRESDKSLTLLAKDYEPSCVYAAGIISRGGAVSFVSQDDRQNLSFFSYAPSDVAARGGNKLICRADCHVGQQTVGFMSYFCKSSLVINSATIQSTLVALKQQEPFFGKLEDDQRFGLHFGSTDGGFGCIISTNEDIFWRLLALQSVMSNALESDCSLSQRAWRLYRRTPRRGGCKSNDRRKGVIDGDLVIKFVDLPIKEQEEIASAIGSTVDLILDNLLDVSVSSMIV